MNAARLVRERGQEVRGESNQRRAPRVEWASLGGVRTVRASCGPGVRAAASAVRTSDDGLHRAPAPVASDFSLDTTRLNRRDSARPQSALSELAVVVFPLTPKALVVQWRRTVPPRGRTAGISAGTAQVPQYWNPRRWPFASTDRPHRAQFDCRASVAIVPTFLAETGGGALDCLVGVVRPWESGSTRYHIETGNPRAYTVYGVPENEEAPFGASEPPARRRADLRIRP